MRPRFNWDYLRSERVIQESLTLVEPQDSSPPIIYATRACIIVKMYIIYGTADRYKTLVQYPLLLD